MKITPSRILMALIGLAVLAGLVFAFIPAPAIVDVAEATRGHMRATVDEDGRTRIRDRYIVSAPLTGQIQRIILRPGDAVEAGETTLTTIAPTDPALLDARAVAESEARVRRAEAALRQAHPNREEARARYDYAENELARVQAAHARGGASRQELEIAELRHRTAMEAFHSAQLSEEIARYELDLARAALLRTRPGGVDADSPEHMPITSPVDGRVLRVFQESMAVVTPGTPLLEIGDPADLEIEIDVLSTDAVKIRPGARIDIEHWGGSRVLEARVRMVEPRAFTHISALGVEEQRVWVIADFVDPPEVREPLGDAYRIEARIVIWEDPDVVKAPTSALFRSDGRWSVFIIEEGRARLREVEIGRITDLEAQVLGGLSPGERVVIHPSDAVRDGGRVSVRE